MQLNVFHQSPASDGKTGVLIPPEDVGALVESMDALLIDGNMRSAFALEWQRRILEGFTLAQSIAKLEQLYESRLRMKQIEV